jgi:hypothetical protein
LVRDTRRTAIARAGLLALCSATIASCGGDEVGADEYVGALCSATAGFTSTVVEGQAAVQEAAAGTVSPEDGKAELTSFFDDATAAGEQAASEVEDAGTPDVENGEEIADALSTAFDNVSAALSDAASDVDALPTDSEESFQNAAEELSTSFQDDVSSIGEGLDQLGESPELESAAEANSECQSLESGIATPTGTTGTS